MGVAGQLALAHHHNHLGIPVLSANPAYIRESQGLHRQSSAPVSAVAWRANETFALLGITKLILFQCGVIELQRPKSSSRAFTVPTTTSGEKCLRDM